MGRLILAIALCAGLGLPALALADSHGKSFLAKYRDQGNGNRELISEGWVERRRSGEGVAENSYPAEVVEDEAVRLARVVEIWSNDADQIRDLLRQREVTRTHGDADPAADEVKTLVDNGPSSNRIDLVFMGDGYQENEKAKFYADVQRLTDDLFNGPTFRSYLPIFNVHAVFRASKDSGIGNTAAPKDTAYKLTRQGKTLRWIFPENLSAARDSCHAAPGCDFPILVGNDPYYGGLGGEFAVTTSSPISGAIVLRHELGHNFGEVGEEYDGDGFYGANYAPNLDSVGWRHWLTGTLRAEPAIARFVEWPWVNLEAGPFTAKFNSSGSGWSAYVVKFSVSGFQTSGDLKLTLDGKPIVINSPGHGDRTFYSIEGNSGFGDGAHELKFVEGNKDGDNTVCSIKMHEFKSDYHSEANYVGAYPLFSSFMQAAGYRPTHEGCLMRSMQHDRFCSVCQENNWLKFFRRVSMIDSVVATEQGSDVTLQVKYPKLGTPGKEINIRWYNDGTEVSELANLESWVKPKSTLSGNWEVSVSFTTPEVRKDSDQLLTARKTVTLP